MALYAIAVWAKVSKWSRPYILFIPFAAADFMKIAFAVGLNQKMMKDVVFRIFAVCTVKGTRLVTLTHKYDSVDILIEMKHFN